MRNVSISICFLYFISFLSCRNSIADFATKWTEETKAKIIEDASKPVDSTFFDTSNLTLTQYHKGIRLKTYKLISYSIDKSQVVKAFSQRSHLFDTAYSIFYGADSSYELIRKYCPAYDKSFEGIKCNGQDVGLAEFKYCNGKLRSKGFRYYTNVGIWTVYDTLGKVIQTIDFHDVKRLEVLRDIKYYR